MHDNPNKTEQQANEDKAIAILAIKFAMITPDSVRYWHMLGLATQTNTQRNTQNTQEATR